jgi:hypothetical protein
MAKALAVSMAAVTLSWAIHHGRYMWCPESGQVRENPSVMRPVTTAAQAAIGWRPRAAAMVTNSATDRADEPRSRLCVCQVHRRVNSRPGSTTRPNSHHLALATVDWYAVGSRPPHDALSTRSYGTQIDQVRRPR